jgi:phosphate transport system substrate-binding protein
MRRTLIIAAILLGIAGSGRAATPAPGLRVWGPPKMAPLAARWAEGYRRQHPGARIELHMAGSDVALAALYTGKADLALVGRPAWEMEAKAFEWVKQYPPAHVAVARGSVSRPGQSPALAIVVHRSNPLAQVSLAQLRAMFTLAQGGDGARVRTWGDLGLTGAWKHRPIHLYMPDAESGSGRRFRELALDGAAQLDWPRIREFAEPLKRGAYTDRSGLAVNAAVARDPAGLGLGLVASGGAPVKALALGASEGAAFTRPDRESVRSGTYPLGGSLYAYFDRTPGRPLDAQLLDFLRFVLSPPAQTAGEAAGYLALPDEARAKSVAALQ